MAYYHVHGLIPEGISQSEAYKIFEKDTASGLTMDNFDGFELTSRFHGLETGEFLRFSRLIINQAIFCSIDSKLRH